jgi:hypothetical protein
MHQFDAGPITGSKRDQTGNQPEQRQDYEDDRFQEIDPGKSALLDRCGTLGEGRR